jgi:uncharacterized protein
VITTNEIHEIVAKIRARFDPEKIILFGSFGTDAAAAESDVDLMIVAETDLSARERFPAVSRLLGDYPAAFDVVFKTPHEYRRSRDVVNHIVYIADKYGKVIYERGDTRGGPTVDPKG